MGSVFGFVSSDVKSKIEILEMHRQKENAEQFESFSKMLDYEKSSALLDKKDYVSGSRTLLRLHRGLGMYLLCYRNAIQLCQVQYLKKNVHVTYIM